MWHVASHRAPCGVRNASKVIGLHWWCYVMDFRYKNQTTTTTIARRDRYKLSLVYRSLYALCTIIRQWVADLSAPLWLLQHVARLPVAAVAADAAVDTETAVHFVRLCLINVFKLQPGSPVRQAAPALVQYLLCSLLNKCSTLLCAFPVATDKD